VLVVRFPLLLPSFAPSGTVVICRILVGPVAPLLHLSFPSRSRLRCSPNLIIDRQDLNNNGKYVHQTLARYFNKLG
jgi:hypothetical protein